LLPINASVETSTFEVISVAVPVSNLSSPSNVFNTPEPELAFEPLITRLLK
jgi:hypothetical protein